VAVGLNRIGKEFTLIFLRVFFQDLVYAVPILIFLVLLIIVIVSVRKVVESYEADVIQVSCRTMEDKTDVDIRKSRLL
jgi:hypothetical protein